MVNTTARLYIRSATGYSSPPRKLADLPTGQIFHLVWYEGNLKPARSFGRFADKAHAIKPVANWSRFSSYWRTSRCKQRRGLGLQTAPPQRGE
jgi:hypothetical protein